MVSNSPLIVIVGNCCSGKTTLANNLVAKGYKAKAVLQEHAISKKMWRRSNPDILIHLSCNLKSAKKRRIFSWGEEKLKSQKILLSDAYENADLRIVTDELTISEVLKLALEYLEKRINDGDNNSKRYQKK